MILTAMHYARFVQTQADNAAAQPFNQGESYRNLANFLWQPFVPQATTMAPPASAPVSNNVDTQFASLFRVSQQGIEKVNFTTIAEFHNLGDSVMPTDTSFTILLLRGYPCPQWLNALGSKYRIDPEFYLRHLIFSCKSYTESTMPTRTATHFLPSHHGGMITLQVAGIGCHEAGSGSFRGDKRLSQAELDRQRRSAALRMADYMGKLSTLNTRGFEPGHSFIREYSIHDHTQFSVEQTMSIAFHRVKGRWMGK
jgi:hypothetical protein